MSKKQISALRISIANPEKIKNWGGEVLQPETINYRTGRPEPDGLFCEKIFGPTISFECYCGKYKNVRRDNLECEVCGVSVTHKRVRRRWMGTIKLAASVVHPWFLSIQPKNVLQNVLGLSKRATKQIVYYMKYAVVFLDEKKKMSLLDREDFVYGESKISEEEIKAFLEKHGESASDGTIPEGYKIYHLNGDAQDDRAENLWVLKKKDHTKLHAMIKGAKKKKQVKVKKPSWDDQRHVAKQLGISVSEELTVEQRQKVMSMRLQEYNGSLKEWIEAEIQLLLSRTSRPKYWNKTTARELLFQEIGASYLSEPFVDEKSGEVILDVETKIEFRTIQKILDSIKDVSSLKKMNIKVGKTKRSLEKMIDQRTSKEVLKIGVDEFDPRKGQLWNDQFWNFLKSDNAFQIANIKEIALYNEVQERALMAQEHLINGLDLFWGLKGYDPLKEGDSESAFMFSGDQKRNLDNISRIIEKRGNIPAEQVFKIETGGKAIKEMLKRIDGVGGDDSLATVVNTLDKTLPRMTKTRSRDVKKRLRVMKQFLRSRRYADIRPNRLEWMVFETLPVIPPDLRPIVSLEGGRQATSDINELYHRVVTRNKRLKNMVKIRAPEVIVNNEKRLLQQSVDALFDNQRSQKADKDPNGRPFESLTDTLRGKKGRFRQNLLGKRVDYSARAVIVAGPTLKLWQCGLPKKIALELYKPKLRNVLEEKGLIDGVSSKDPISELLQKGAKERRLVWDILAQLIDSSVVMLNRAPTLHRLGIQAFQPILTDESAIRLHPLVCTPFNADFDGDQMAVHLPLSEGAQAEARLLMLSTNNPFVPGTGSPSNLPSQDVILGLAYLTSNPKDQVKFSRNDFSSAKKLEKNFIGHVLTRNLHSSNSHFQKSVNAKWSYFDQDLIKEIRAKWPKEFQEMSLPVSKIRASFTSESEARLAYESQRIIDDEKGSPLSVRDVILVRNAKKGSMVTTVGRVIFNEILPENISFVDTPVYIKELRGINNRILKECPQSDAIKICDSIKDLGFRQSSLAGISLSVDDVIIPKRKQRIISLAEEVESLVQNAYSKGLLTPELAGMCNQRLKTNLTFAEKNPRTKGLELVRPNELGRPKDKKHNNVPERWSDGLSPISGKKLNSRRFDKMSYERIIEALWNRATERITELLIEAGEQAEDNSLMLMINSGARGKMDQVRQLAGMRGLMADPTGKLILSPIKSNFKEGLSVHEYFSSTHGARKGQTDTALRTSRSGYLTRRLVDIAHSLYIVEEDCGAVRGITKRPHFKTKKEEEQAKSKLGPKWYEKDGPLNWNSFERRIIHRYTSEKIYDENGEMVCDERVLITDKNVKGIIKTVKSRSLKLLKKSSWSKLNKAGVTGVKLLSPITCNSLGGCCARCYGYNKATDSPVAMADPVGVIAAQSIGEPGTQLTMRTFHTGGVAGSDVSDITQGLPLAEIFFEVYQSRFKPDLKGEGAVLSPVSGVVTNIKELQDNSRYSYEVSISPKGKKGRKTKMKSGDFVEIMIPKNRDIEVRVGDELAIADAISSGLRSPIEILASQGIDAAQSYTLDKIQNVYRSQGVDIFDIHFEVILKEMFRYVKVIDGGDSTYMPDDKVPINEIRLINQRLKDAGRSRISWEQIMVGLKKGASNSSSFLSAASFQMTASALMEAAIEGKLDFLNGLKENVIVGERVPVGTGFRNFEDVGYEVEGSPFGTGVLDEDLEGYSG